MKRLQAWLLAIALGSPGIADAKPPSQPSNPPEIEAVLNSTSYGYTLTCIINGHDIGVNGGESESRREYAEGSAYAGRLSAKDREQYAALHIGRNTIKITYTRKLPKEPFGLDMTFEVLGYPAPVFYAHLEDHDRDTGTFEGVFAIAAQPAADFRPLVFTTAEPGTSGLIFVDQDHGGDGVLTPRLNGQLLMQMLGRPRGVVPFTGLHPGANTLDIEYSTKGAPLRVYILGPKSASMHVLQSAQKTHESFTVEGGDAATSRH